MKYGDIYLLGKHRLMCGVIIKRYETMTEGRLNFGGSAEDEG